MGLGHAFVANMTGNTVLLGISIFEERGDILHPFISLVFYAFGVALGSFFTRNVKQGSIWNKSVSRVLFLEALLLIASQTAWMSARGTPNMIRVYCVLGCVATAIGLQSGALLALRLPGIITTYITGTWTTLVRGLVLISGSGEKIPQGEPTFEDRLLIQIIFLAVYFCAAVATGWSLRALPTLVGVISSVPVLGVAVYGAIRG
jgi:uncharacterized membrane protein YoaK (UPF0700 family)